MKNKTVLNLLTLFLIFCNAAVFGKHLSITPVFGKKFDPGTVHGKKVPKQPPEFNFTLHKDHFEVVIKTPLLPGRKPESIATGNDDLKIFSRDVAEFLISTDPEQKIYYHIALAPSGHCYTARKRDTSWNPDIRTLIRLNSGSWEAVMQIPYREIGTTAPTAKSVWLVNFSSKVRIGRSKKVCASWSGSENFHDISQMGIIDFKGEKRAKLTRWQLRDDIFSARLYVPFPRDSVKAVFEMDGKAYPAEISGNYYSWQVPLLDRDIYLKIIRKIRLALYTADGKKLFECRADAEPDSPPELMLKYFYCPLNMKGLPYTHTFGIPAKLLLKDAAGMVIGSYPAKSAGVIPLKGLKPGKYTAELISGKKRTTRMFLMVPDDFALESIAANARMHLKGSLICLDGKPFFPVAQSGNRKEFHITQDPAFNMYMGRYNQGTLPNAVKILSVNTRYFKRKPSLSAHLYKDADRRMHRDLSPKLPHNRFITRLAYEAQIPVTCGNPAAPTRLDNIKHYTGLFKKAKKIAPDRIYSIQVDAFKRWGDFIGICDIFEASSWESSYAVHMMQNLERDMRNIRKIAGNKPVIYWLGGSIPNGICRTAEELRAGAYCAVMLGLNGIIIHTGHDGIARQRTRLWSVISGIAAELQPIYREFSSGTEIRDFVREIRGEAIWAVRKCGKKTVMILVSKLATEQKLHIKTRGGDIDLTLTPFEPVYHVWHNK